MVPALNSMSANAALLVLQALLQAVEPPRQEMFRRLNLAPGGTSALVGMRQDLIEHGGKAADLASVEDDLVHLLSSWFNRGFLMMQRITWSSPADILERTVTVPTTAGN